MIEIPNEDIRQIEHKLTSARVYLHNHQYLQLKQELQDALVILNKKQPAKPDPKPPRGKSTQTKEEYFEKAEQLRAKAYSLRINGCTYDEIGKELGYTGSYAKILCQRHERKLHLQLLADQK